MLNNMLYDVNLPDVSIHKYGENVISDNMYSQVYFKDYLHSILSRILYFYKDTTAFQKGDQYIITKSGQRRMWKSTVGWNLLISCKYGSKQLIPLLAMKESNQIEVAAFATAHDISEEPSFAWWVPYILQKRDKIISAFNARVKWTTHKYGLDVSCSVKEAYALDTKNGNTLWQYALDKEMSNLRVAFNM